MTQAVDLGVQAAGAWKRCPAIIEAIYSGDYDGITSLELRTSHSRECTQKCVLGRIYGLPDTVKVPCNPVEVVFGGGSISRSVETGNPCPECGGRGWTASTDLAVWEEAIFSVWTYSHISKRHGLVILLPDCINNMRRPKYAGSGQPLEALQSAIAQALVADGWTLGEG